MEGGGEVWGLIATESGGYEGKGRGTGVEVFGSFVYVLNMGWNFGVD